MPTSQTKRTEIPELSEELERLLLQLRVPQIAALLLEMLNAEASAPRAERWPPRKLPEALAKLRRCSLARAVVDLAYDVGLVHGGGHRRLRRRIGEPMRPVARQQQNLPPAPWDRALDESRRRLEEEMRRPLVSAGSPRLKAAREDFVANLRTSFVAPWRLEAATAEIELRSLAWQAAEIADQQVLLNATVRRAEHLLLTGEPVEAPPEWAEDARRQAALTKQLMQVIAAKTQLEKQRAAAGAAAPRAASAPPAALSTPSHVRLSSEESRR